MKSTYTGKYFSNYRGVDLRGFYIGAYLLKALVVTRVMIRSSYIFTYVRTFACVSLYFMFFNRSITLSFHIESS